MGISGTATGGGGAIWPRLDLVKQTVRIAQLGGPRRMQFAGSTGDSTLENDATSVPRGLGPGFHPFRVAIDASIWIYQTSRSLDSHAVASRPTSANSSEAQYGRNQPLRTLFYRLCRLLKSGLFPVFVFDNPNPRSRPAHKHGGHHSLGKEVLAMQDKFKSMVTLFGMPYIVSKSEAEAECAELNRRGLVDAVMSEDVDTLLFGAETIVRGWTATASPPSSQVVILDGESADAPVSSTPTSTPKSVSSPNATLDIYSASLVASHASIGLSRNALILFALLNGSDYTEGIKQLGAMTAYECVRDDPTALGPQLIKAIVEPFLLDQAKERFTPTERAAIHATLKDHLINNPSKLLSRKKPSAASNIPSNFPPGSVIRSYLRPSVYLEYPQDLLDHLANPFSVPVDWNELQTMAQEEFGWGSRKLDDKFSKTVAEAVAFWEIRKATDAALRLGASSSGEILLDQGDFVVSSSPVTDSGRGQAAITDFFGQIKKRPSASGEGKSAPSSQATVSSPRGSSQEQRNPIVGIVNIKKARDTGDGANDDTEQTLPGDEGMECKVRVRLLSMRSTGGATQSSSSSQGRLHPFADDIEIRIPLSMARVAAPRLVREHETSKTPKKTPKKREVPTTPPPAPKKKQKKTVVEPRDLDDSDIQVLDSLSFRKGSASTSTSTRPPLIPSTRGKGLFSSTATPKSSRSMATSSTSFPKPTEDQESNPFLEDSEPKEKPTERVYKPMLWNESWEKPARFSPRK